MKSHYQALDGLRGTAAFSVVLFHIWEMLVPDLAHNPMPHTFLAVDFFFALSGFVVGHAYDARMAPAARAPLTFWGFAKRRLIRLHPMIVPAVIISVVVYLLDPFVDHAPRVGILLSWPAFSWIVALSLLLLPTPALPDTFGETHPLNGPSWTLFQEYIANLLYGLFGRKLTLPVHLGLCAVSGVALIATAQHFGDLGHGWSWSEFWVAPVRLACPFLLGLLVSRLGWKLRLPHPFLILSIVLLAVFCAPVMGKLNGLFEATCIMIVFPLVLICGTAVHDVPGLQGRLCRLMGDLSYPVYIIHYAFIYLFAHWNWHTHPQPPLLGLVAAGLYVGVTALAYVLMRWYDKPVRAWLARVCLEPRQTEAALPVTE